MGRNNRNLQKGLYLVAAIVLLAGLGSAILIYLKAGNASSTVMGYEPENSKVYMHDLELYGGKANVLANEFISWFAGLWHGKSLAFTVGCITVALSAGFYIVARYLSSDMGSDVRSGTDQDRKDRQEYS